MTGSVTETPGIWHPSFNYRCERLTRFPARGPLYRSRRQRIWASVEDSRLNLQLIIQTLRNRLISALRVLILYRRSTVPSPRSPRTVPAPRGSPSPLPPPPPPYALLENISALRHLRPRSSSLPLSFRTPQFLRVAIPESTAATTPRQPMPALAIGSLQSLSGTASPS